MIFNQKVKKNYLSTLETRDPDGEGNNLLHTDWGSAGALNRRITPNSYTDGKGEMAPPNSGVTARSITDAVMDGGTADIPNKAGLNEWFQFVGQFLAHDINQTVGGTTEFFPMDGVVFGFARNAFVEVGGVRQHIDQETSFLDLGTIYGRNQEMLNLLRANTVDAHGNTIQSAKLLAGPDGLPPTIAQVAADAGLTIAEVATAFGIGAFGPINPGTYVVGDDRANQTPALLAPHVVWQREHNIQVEQLAQKYPEWTQDQLFNAARAITEAEWQAVVYNEYLPKLIGENALKPYKGYKADVDPAIINEFASVAFRFGHDQSSNLLLTLNENGSLAADFTLEEAFNLGNLAQALRTTEDVDAWIRGLTSQYTQEIDGKVVDGNRNALFGLGQTIDLMALDIQRGRDQGTGNYNELREGLGFKTYGSFDEYGKANKLDAATLTALKDVYGNDVGKLDSLVGGLLEKESGGGILGETLSKIIKVQFEVLRDGDRFFYLNQFKNDPAMISKIEATSFADILERTTGIDYVYHDAFAAHTRLSGGNAAETLKGTAKNELIMGLDGNDTLYGGAGNDDIHGGTGADRLYGEAGKDYLIGGAGEDMLWGGANADTFVFKRGSGHDKVMDFNFLEDRIDLSDFGIDSWSSLKFTRYNGGSIIDLGNGDRLEIANVDPIFLLVNDFLLG